MQHLERRGRKPRDPHGCLWPDRVGLGYAGGMTALTARPARLSRPSGHWQEHDYDVFAGGEQPVGRIFLGVGNVAREAPWIWSITCRVPSDTADRGHAADLEAAKTALKARWETIHADG